MGGAGVGSSPGPVPVPSTWAAAAVSGLGVRVGSSSGPLCQHQALKQQLLCAALARLAAGRKWGDPAQADAGRWSCRVGGLPCEHARNWKEWEELWLWEDIRRSSLAWAQWSAVFGSLEPGRLELSRRGLVSVPPTKRLLLSASYSVPSP